VGEIGFGFARSAVDSFTFCANWLADVAAGGTATGEGVEDASIFVANADLKR
jgi:hypothetical protein